MNPAFLWTLYIVLAVLFVGCFGVRLLSVFGGFAFGLWVCLLFCLLFGFGGFLFLWRISLPWFVACFSPNSLCSPCTASCIPFYCILATAIHLSRAPEEEKSVEDDMTRTFGPQKKLCF